MLNIGGLNEGVVIDHIKAGSAMKIYEYLNLEKQDLIHLVPQVSISAPRSRKNFLSAELPEGFSGTEMYTC